MLKTQLRSVDSILQKIRGFYAINRLIEKYFSTNMDHGLHLKKHMGLFTKNAKAD